MTHPRSHHLTNAVCCAAVAISIFLLSSASALTPKTDEESSNCDELPHLQEQANQNDATAQFALAKIYFKGICVERNIDEGGKWLGLSAHFGYGPAEFLLAALFHRDGDDAAALEWTLKAATKGNADGQWLAAYLYTSGVGIDNNDVEAAKWAKRSADQGNKEGQILLGGFLITGQGMKKDYIEADKWFRIANGVHGHTKVLPISQTMIEASMSNAEIAEAQRRADAFKPHQEAGSE